MNASGSIHRIRRNNQCQDDTNGMSRHRFSPFIAYRTILSKLLFTQKIFPVPIQQNVVFYNYIRTDTLLHATRVSGK